MKTYKTKLEAEKARSEDDSNNSVFCPLIASQCNTHCVCFNLGNIILLEHGDLEGQYILNANYCGNMMFYRE